MFWLVWFTRNELYLQLLRLLISQVWLKEQAKAKCELFHISVDPFEEKDLAESEPERVKALEARLAELRREDVDKGPDDLKDVPR